MSLKKASVTLVFVCLVLLLLSAVVIHSAEQYKLQTRDSMAQVVDGKYDKAIKNLSNYLKKNPGDLESMYGLAVAYALKKDINQAVAYARQAVDEGLPFGRFLAGPRDLLTPLTDSAEFKQLAEKHTVAHVAELLHGPMLGSVTDSTAKFWIRTANEVPVQVVIRELENKDTLIKIPIVRTDKNKDFTAVITAQGLKSDTSYWYSLMVDNVSWSTGWVFRTFPSTGTKAKFQIGFGGGAGYTPQHERMWDTIAAYKPYISRLPFFFSVTMFISTTRQDRPYSSIVIIAASPVLNSATS